MDYDTDDTKTNTNSKNILVHTNDKEVNECLKK